MFKCIRTVFWTHKPSQFLQHNTPSSNFESNSRSKHQLVTPNITDSRPLHSCNQSNHEAPPSHSQHHPQRCPSHPAGKFQPNPPTAKTPSQTNTSKTSSEPATTPDGFGLMDTPATCGVVGTPCTQATLHLDCCPPPAGNLRTVCKFDTKTCGYMLKLPTGGCAQDELGLNGGVCG